MHRVGSPSAPWCGTQEKWALQDISASRYRAARRSASSARTAPARARCSRSSRASRHRLDRHRSTIEGARGLAPRARRRIPSRDFTGRDNIFMNAAIMGLSKARGEASASTSSPSSPSSASTCDRPVRTYSSGMIDAARVLRRDDGRTPTILILDEILAVGDQHFQKKCMDRIRDIRQSGTHDPLRLALALITCARSAIARSGSTTGKTVMEAATLHPKVTDEYHQLPAGSRVRVRPRRPRLAEAEATDSSSPRLPHLGDVKPLQAPARIESGPRCSKRGEDGRHPRRRGPQPRWRGPPCTSA